MVDMDDADERTRRAHAIRKRMYNAGNRRRTILFGGLDGLVFVIAGGVTAGIAVNRTSDEESSVDGAPSPFTAPSSILLLFDSMCICWYNGSPRNVSASTKDNGDWMPL
jgi:hypothetical protein